MEKPFLSNMIDYKRDIEPYPFIQIFSGVGSGKNVFINKLINGHTYIGEDGEPYTVPPKSVLLITSRRAKVEEIKMTLPPMSAPIFMSGRMAVLLTT